MKVVRVVAIGLSMLVAAASLAQPRRDAGEKTCWRCSCSGDGGCQCWLISGPACR